MKNEATTKFIAVAISNVIDSFVSVPKRRLLTILQTRGEFDEEERRSSVSGVVRTVLKEEGVRGFWRGMWVSSIAFVPSYFASPLVVQCVKQCLQTIPDGSLRQHIGPIASATALTLTSGPLNYLRVALLADVGPSQEFSGALDCAQKVYASKGISGLFTGCELSFVGIVVYRLSYFGLHALLKPLSSTNNILQMFLVAQFVSIASASLSYPVNLVANRMIVDSARNTKKYRNAVDCAVKIVKKEGISGLFSGLSTTIVVNYVSAFTSVGIAEFINIQRKK